MRTRGAPVGKSSQCRILNIAGGLMGSDSQMQCSCVVSLLLSRRVLP